MGFLLLLCLNLSLPTIGLNLIALLFTLGPSYLTFALNLNTI